MSEDKIKITSVKGRPMLNWVGKKSLDYVKGFPSQLVETFDPLSNERYSQMRAKKKFSRLQRKAK